MRAHLDDKPRRVDYSPDNMIAGIAGQLDLEEFAVYWIVCTLIYSKSAPIKNDPAWIAGIFRKVNPRTIRAVLDRLVAMAKVDRTDAELMVKRCRIEIEAASKRIRTARENGMNGGRPRIERDMNGQTHSLKNNGVGEPDGFPSGYRNEKLARNDGGGGGGGGEKEERPTQKEGTGGKGRGVA